MIYTVIFRIKFLFYTKHYVFPFFTTILKREIQIQICLFMKTIYIVRHAKSSWKFLKLSDKLRPLNKRGYQSASLIGNALFEKNVQFDKIISSPATRALSTAQILSTILNYKIKNIEISEDFYTFSDAGNIIFDRLKQLPNYIDSVAVFGHNSTLENIAHKLSNGEILHFPTCAVLALQYDASTWDNLSMDVVKIQSLLTPKQLDFKI